MSQDSRHIMFIFPGQGSQYRGMGSDLYNAYDAAKRVYDQANAVLGYDLTGLSFDGPDDKLNLTRFTQPALLTHSVACLEVFKGLTENKVAPVVAAGHSLGEYSALVAAGALSFEDALRLVQTRGDLMGEHGEGEMSAFPMDITTVQPLAEKYFCAVAACNLPDQTVIGGRGEDLDAAASEAAELYPRKRVVRLKTEGAFHTYYMVGAARHFRGVLDKADFAPSDVKVMSNYTGDFHDADPGIIKARLFFQLFHPVQWIGGLQKAMQAGVTHFVEFGGGIGAGETPEAKRPNLESIIKKAMRAFQHQADYAAAINCETVAKAAELFKAGS